VVTAAALEQRSVGCSEQLGTAIDQRGVMHVGKMVLLILLCPEAIIGNPQTARIPCGSEGAANGLPLISKRGPSIE